MPIGIWNEKHDDSNPYSEVLKNLLGQIGDLYFLGRNPIIIEPKFKDVHEIFKH